MRFGSTAKVLLKCKLKYYRISECPAEAFLDIAQPAWRQHNKLLLRLAQHEVLQLKQHCNPPHRSRSPEMLTHYSALPCSKQFVADNFSCLWCGTAVRNSLSVMTTPRCSGVSLVSIETAVHAGAPASNIAHLSTTEQRPLLSQCNCRALQIGAAWPLNTSGHRLNPRTLSSEAAAEALAAAEPQPEGLMHMMLPTLCF